MVSGLFVMFADYAKKFGVEASKARLQGDLPDEKIAELAEQYENAVAKVHSGGPLVIAATHHEPWYSGAGDDSIFWNPLKQHFVSDGWSEDRLDGLDRASDHVVAHTPRPSKPSFRAKGLVVGYVQSGKTTNFTSVIAKLADEDYRMVIVLSGIHNGLRRQTQKRLDAQLRSLNPDRWMTLTSEDKDFIKPTFSASAALSSDKSLLAVVKKNAAVLRRLVKWLEEPGAQDALKTARVLVIDDEADQASVATNQINPLIQKILGYMPRSTYIGYTATPFANVFIDPSEKNDLYPRDFILNLPRPDGYFGPDKIFGRDVVETDDSGRALDGYDMVRLVPEETVGDLLPLTKADVPGFTPAITDELADAIRWFWLATAAKRARGLLDHSTMLIHTSVKIDVHEAYREPLEALRRAAISQIRSGGVALEEWRAHWDRESVRVPAEDFGRVQTSWEEVRAHLLNVVERTKVVLDNYRSADRLNYEGEEKVVAIAVGGNTLSRGLTLEGLVVSFFVRSASAYDTLLQMGRWFGFRTGYEDLPRIWMTEALVAAFRHLSTVEHEMRADIDYYQQQNATPVEVAVRIRTHPLLRVTAKMGAAIPAYVSFAGRRLQTRYFNHKDAEWLERNLEATRRLVERVARSHAEVKKSSVTLYRNVDAAEIVQFLEQYQVHEESTDLDTELMRKYIAKQQSSETPSLSKWSVAVVAGEKDGKTEIVDLGGLQVPSVVRARLREQGKTRADIKTLMSKVDRALDLPVPLAELRLLREQDLTAKRNEDDELGKQGLLVVYPIDRTSKPQNVHSKTRDPLDAVFPVIGIGVVFPGDAAEKNRIFATHVAVDLKNVEDAEGLEEILESDSESEA
ncbi:Z1 domain-containing protein [Diaminobutyricimonas aerilata]|uniref:Z1 domain-containing protein n=1 Tax=Diaminobutyricimonas aerilata TaxID=1162967 RepID=A0A2M9CM38_9MICO|nr:Z1 domain-containing protein [Diaminobutyricimonas aerilata]PJJ72952.1 Z1 domain-containing protein [Diaminobutyricimonas aerilata]